MFVIHLVAIHVLKFLQNFNSFNFLGSLFQELVSKEVEEIKHMSKDIILSNEEIKHLSKDIILSNEE